MNKNYYFIFKVDNLFFALPIEEKTKIYNIEKKEYLKLKDLISIKSVLKNELKVTFRDYEKSESYNYIEYENHKIILPLKFYKISIEKQIEDNGKNLICEKIEFNGKKVIILSIKWIFNNYFIIENNENYSNNIIEIEQISIENLYEDKMEEIKKNKPSDSNFDEEKKKEIFDQIENEIDKLKISNFNEVQKKYMKQSKSFAPQIISLYSILLVLAVVVFVILNIVSNQQQARMAQDVKSIGNMESLIIRELQKKQEQEKAQLNEQLKEITLQLESIQKQKEQFEKDQIIALNNKTKLIEDQFEKKIEEEKNKLNRGLISKAEYDKRIKELLAEKDKRLKEARQQSDEQRKAFQEQMQAKEDELKAKENSYKQAIAEKEKQIKQAKQEIKAAEEKLALSEEAQKKIEQENEQLKQSSALQIKLKETILFYYKAILQSYQNNNQDALKKALNDFYSFIFTNPSAAIIAEDEKLFDKFIIDMILSDLVKKETDEQKKEEKTNLLEKAYNEHKKGNLVSAYEYYYKAFLKYDIVVDNEKIYFEDFIHLVFEKQYQEGVNNLEAAALPLFNSILTAFKEKNYSLVIQLSNDFLSQYSNSKNALTVVEYKIKAEINQQNKEQEDLASSIFQKAKKAYNEKDYDLSMKYLLELFSKYGNTSYSTLASELLQNIYISVKQNSISPIAQIEENQEADEIRVGNIFKIFPEIVQILKDPNLSIKINIGDQLIVKHKNENGVFITVAIVKITSYATTIINAKILKIYGKGPAIGDFVYLIKK